MNSNAPQNLLHRARRASLPLALAFTMTAGIGLAGDGYKKKAPSVAQLFEILVSVEECAPVDTHTCSETCTQGWKAGEKLGGMIVKDSARFEEFAPLFRAQFAAEPAGDLGRGRLLGFLASCPCESSAALGEELFVSSPSAFSESNLVAFADMGSKSLKKQLVWRVKAGESESILPAAYLAFCGDDIGRKSLARAAKAEPSLATVDEALLAAAALDALAGPEAGTPALDSVLLRVHDSVVADLDRGNLAEARGLALAARAVVHKLEAQERAAYGFSLNNLQTVVAWTLRSKAEKLGSAEQVFEVIEEITPIS